jgi:hypothetical protein
LHFLADGWTASFPSRFAAPPLEKGVLMPLEHRLGFHQLGENRKLCHLNPFEFFDHTG